MKGDEKLGHLVRRLTSSSKVKDLFSLAEVLKWVKKRTKNVELATFLAVESNV